MCPSTTFNEEQLHSFKLALGQFCGLLLERGLGLPRGDMSRLDVKGTWIMRVHEQPEFHELEQHVGAPIAALHGLAPGEITTWLAWRSLASDPAAALAGALAALGRDGMSVEATLVLSGVRVDRAVSFPNGMRLIKYADLAPSEQKDAFAAVAGRRSFPYAMGTAAIVFQCELPWESESHTREWRALGQSLADLGSCIAVSASHRVVPLVTWERLPLAIPVMTASGGGHSYDGDCYPARSTYALGEVEVKDALELHRQLGPKQALPL